MFFYMMNKKIALKETNRLNRFVYDSTLKFLLENRSGFNFHDVFLNKKIKDKCFFRTS